jgi:hypothetical protein
LVLHDGSMGDRVLSRRELTVALFTRQLLHRDRPAAVQDAVRDLVALQAQYSPSPHIALSARLPGFAVGDLERALVDGTVVKASLMRGTLHLVSAEDFGCFAAAWQQQALTELRGRHKTAGVDEDALLASLSEFTAVPRNAAELRAHVAGASRGTVRTADLLQYARALVPLVHVAPSGHWRAHGKPAMVRWAGERLPAEPAATTRLVRRYLAAFGPAGRDDIAQFTYLRMRQVDPALAELGPLRRYQGEDGRELLDLADAPEPADGPPLPVRFLPKWDATLLSHADRTRILPAAIHTDVYKAVNGECLATYLIDGLVAGTWQHGRRRDVATLTLRPLTHRVTRLKGKAALFAEAERLLAFLEPDASRYEVTFQADG